MDMGQISKVLAGQVSGLGLTLKAKGNWEKTFKEREQHGPVRQSTRVLVTFSKFKARREQHYP